MPRVYASPPAASHTTPCQLIAWASKRAANTPNHGEAFEDYARNRESPFDSEDSPADVSVQRYKREWRIGAGDEQVNGGVVEDLENVPGASPDQRVIKGRAKIDQYECGTEDAATEYHPARAARGGGDEIDCANQCKNSPDAVRDGVG